MGIDSQLKHRAGSGASKLHGQLRMTHSAPLVRFSGGRHPTAGGEENALVGLERAALRQCFSPHPNITQNCFCGITVVEGLVRPDERNQEDSDYDEHEFHALKTIRGLSRLH